MNILPRSDRKIPPTPRNFSPKNQKIVKIGGRGIEIGKIQQFTALAYFFKYFFTVFFFSVISCDFRANQHYFSLKNDRLIRFQQPLLRSQLR
jgi:hypothetical protein